MNANELADFLDMYFSCNQPASNALCDAATMLRQQQAEIEELKEALKILVYIAESTDTKWESQKPIYKLAIMQAKERLKK
jgi:hypothetical protein